MSDDLREQILLDRLDDMLANLQAHIELRANEIAEPRISVAEAQAFDRVAQAEEERDHWRTRFTDLQREHQRQVEVLNRRATRAEAAIARARALHPSAEEAHASQNALCVECCTPAPCPTRKALDDSQEAG